MAFFPFTRLPWLIRRPRLAHLDSGLACGCWRFVFLLKVSPVMPFAATSYSLGLSSLSAGDYLLGTVAALPGYVRLGRLAHAGLTADAAAAGPLRPTLLAVGMVATLLLTLYGVRLVVQALRLDE